MRYNLVLILTGLLAVGCTPTVTVYRPDASGRYVRVSTSQQRGASPYDDSFMSRVDQSIAREQSTDHPGTSHQSAKDYWQAWYRGIRSSPAVGWQPSEFKSSEALVAYIKQKRREHGLPTYD